MQVTVSNELVPAALAGLQLRRTREQVIRAICRGDLPGTRIDGKWYVTRSALESHCDTQPAGASPAAGASSAVNVA
jgi:hypothetical protein